MFKSLQNTWLFFAVDLLGGGVRVQNQEQSEEDLAIKMSGGDDHAFDVLYERYFDQLFGFVKRRVDSAEIAEDLVSSVFLKVFASRTRFSKGSFKAWLYRIANNTIIDHYRTKKSTVAYDSDRHEIKSSEVSVLETLDQLSLRNVLEEVISKLDNRSQLVLQLKFFSELSNEEIAVTLKVSTNHVGVLLYRALKKCAQLFPKNIKI